MASDTHHEFVSAEEVERIENDPVLSVKDVVTHREEADG